MPWALMAPEVFAFLAAAWSSRLLTHAGQLSASTYTTKTADLSSSIPWSRLCGDQVPFGTVDPMLADSPLARPSLSAHVILVGEKRTGRRQNELSQGQVCSTGSDLMDPA